MRISKPNFVSQIIPEKKVYHFLSSLFFGIFIASVFFIFSLYTLPNLPNWILPTSWAISIGSFVVGVLLVAIDNQQKNIIIFTSKYVLEEMEKLEKQFDKGLK